MADLGPGTMPRGKYPESPAPAGSHALISRAENIRNASGLPRPSRTPTPGGMLHANLGLPRPLPRNFQPPLPQQPSKQTATTPPSSFRNLRREAGPPTGVAAALSRSDCARRVALAKLRRNSFTPTPAAAPRSGLKPPTLPPHRHSGISVARRACLPIGVPGEFFTPYPVAAYVC